MKYILLFILMPFTTVCQNISISGYDYTIDNCNEKIINDSRLSNIGLNKDSITFEIQLVYPNCHLFHPPKVMKLSDSLIINFDSIVQENCLCVGSSIYTFVFSTELMSIIPSIYILKNTERTIGTIHLFPRKFGTKTNTERIEIENYIFNEIDSLGRKQGIWINLPEGNGFKFDSITYYVNNNLIRKINKSHTDLNINQYTVFQYVNNKLFRLYDYQKLYKITKTYDNDSTVIITDTRFDTKGYDRVIQETKIGSNKYCWIYINGKRVIKKECDN